MIWTSPSGHSEEVPCKYSDARIVEIASMLCERAQQSGEQRPHETLSGDTKHCPGCDLISAFHDADAELVEWLIVKHFQETK